MVTKAEKDSAAAAEAAAIRDEAVKLGIDVAGKTAKQIKAALAKSKSAPVKEEEEANVGGKPPAKTAKVVDVVDGGGLIRTYSEDVHGKDFRAHADEFASKVEGRKVVAHEE